MRCMVRMYTVLIARVCWGQEVVEVHNEEIVP